MAESDKQRLGWGTETYYILKGQGAQMQMFGLIEWCDICKEWHPREVDGSRLDNWERVKRELRL